MLQGGGVGPTRESLHAGSGGFRGCMCRAGATLERGPRRICREKERGAWLPVPGRVGVGAARAAVGEQRTAAMRSAAPRVPSFPAGRSRPFGAGWCWWAGGVLLLLPG
jgi:hypothetical protein